MRVETKNKIISVIQQISDDANKLLQKAKDIPPIKSFLEDVIINVIDIKNRIDSIKVDDVKRLFNEFTDRFKILVSENFLHSDVLSKIQYDILTKFDVIISYLQLEVSSDVIADLLKVSDKVAENNIIASFLINCAIKKLLSFNET